MMLRFVDGMIRPQHSLLFILACFGWPGLVPYIGLAASLGIFALGLFLEKCLKDWVEAAKSAEQIETLRRSRH